MKNKVTALLLATTMAISGTAGAFTVSAAEAADSGTLKLSVTTGDGSTSDDKIPTPWYNRLLATNLMFRSLFLADSNLTNAQPDLADSYEISDDKLTYTITLKDGLKWSDGEELTAEDVKFSIETALKAATINSIYTSAFKNISDMSVDGNTITLTLSSPYASMIDVLAQFAILPEHCLKDADPLKLESDAFWTDPVCSGMYTLDELNVGNYFTLKRNENYEGEAPKIANVTCYFVSDYITAAQAGNADYVYGNAADMVEALEGMDNYTEHEVDVLFYKYFIFNMKGADGNVNEAMDNVEVRKALVEAIDRATLATLYPTAKVLNSGVPNDNEAYNGFEYTFDAEKAKSDLEAAGYEALEAGKVIFFAGGTGHPYFSTDTGAVLRAIEIEADAMLLAKAIDGIYDSDPKVNPEAVKYDEVSIQEVIDKKLAAVDLTASILCLENKMPMLVFGLNEENSIVETMSGNFTGTKVTV